MTATAPDARMCVSSLIREAYQTDAAKHAARAAGVSHRTTQAWVTGRREPSASTLLRMADQCDRMAAVLERMIDARQAARRARSDAEIASRVDARPGAAVT